MEKRPIVAALVTLAVGAALFALQPAGDDPVATPQQPAPPATAAGGKVRPMLQTPTSLAPDAPPAVDPAARDLPPVAAAIADFALRNRLDPADVALRRLQAVTWPDGALGCPQPGSMVTQALVDGYWLELEGGGQDAEYHTDGNVHVVSCRSGPPAGSGGGATE